MWTGSGSSWLSWHLTVKWLEQLGLLQSWFLSLVTFRHFANLAMRVCVCVLCVYIYIYMCVFVKSFICLAFYISLTEPIALSQAEQVALNYLMMESAYSLNGLATRLRSIEHQQALLLQLLDSIAAIARQPQLQTADLVWWAHSRIATPAVCLTAMRLLQPKKNWKCKVPVSTCFCFNLFITSSVWPSDKSAHSFICTFHTDWLWSPWMETPPWRRRQTATMLCGCLVSGLCTPCVQLSSWFYTICRACSARHNWCNFHLQILTGSRIS